MPREPIISDRTRFRHPNLCKVGDFSIIDDFSYISTRVEIGRFCHLAAGLSIAGGSARLFRLGDFSGVSAGAKIWCTSDDATNDLFTITPPEAGYIKENSISGDVTTNRCIAIGTNAVVMPGNHIPEGVVIGALSFVPAFYDKFEPWTVYAGIPIRPIKKRNRESVLVQVDQLEQFYSDFIAGKRQ